MPCHPQVATAPVLVLVGAMMMGESDQIEWHNMLVAVPAFLTIVVQPFTFSIANGIYAGLLMSATVYLLTGSFLEGGAALFASLRRGEGGVDGAGDDNAVLDAAGTHDGALGANGKDDAALEAPLLGGGSVRGGGLMGGSGGSRRGSGASLAADELRQSSAISITGRLGSRDAQAAGSLSRSHPYERSSFGMYVNTHGSHTGHAPGLSAGLHGLGSPQAQHDPFAPGGSAPPTNDRYV